MVMRSANSNQNNGNSSSAQVGGRASPPPSAAKPNANNATSVVNMNPPRTPLTPSNQKHIAAQPHSPFTFKRANDAAYRKAASRCAKNAAAVHRKTTGSCGIKGTRHAA